MEVLSSSSLVMESAPSMASLMQDLQRALTLEAKFQPRLQLPTGNSNGGVSLSFLIFLFLIFYYMSLNYFAGNWRWDNFPDEGWCCPCTSVLEGVVWSPFLCSAGCTKFDGQVWYHLLYLETAMWTLFFFFHSGSSVGWKHVQSTCLASPSAPSTSLPCSGWRGSTALTILATTMKILLPLQVPYRYRDLYDNSL